MGRHCRRPLSLRCGPTFYQFHAFYYNIGTPLTTRNPGPASEQEIIENDEFVTHVHIFIA